MQCFDIRLYNLSFLAKMPPQLMWTHKPYTLWTLNLTLLQTK